MKIEITKDCGMAMKLYSVCDSISFQKGDTIELPDDCIKVEPEQVVDDLCYFDPDIPCEFRKNGNCTNQQICCGGQTKPEVINERAKQYRVKLTVEKSKVGLWVDGYERLNNLLQDIDKRLTALEKRDLLPRIELLHGMMKDLVNILWNHPIIPDEIQKIQDKLNEYELEKLQEKVK